MSYERAAAEDHAGALYALRRVHEDGKLLREVNKENCSLLELFV